MIDYTRFLESEENQYLDAWLPLLPDQIAKGLCTQRYGDLKKWFSALESLPQVNNVKFDLHDAVRLSQPTLTESALREIEELFKALIPWRKGPYELFDFKIDTEWRSDWKWERLLPHIQPLHNRRVLDVGCGNGYHCLRMRGAGAKQVIGIDPSPRFIVQFYMLKHFLGSDLPVDIFPIAMEAMPSDMPVFDSTFSMGVLYHRRSPIDHIRELRSTLRPGGELILETLVIDGELGECLVPEGRYAKMRNTWFFPSVPSLLSWLKKCGFEDAKCVDLNQTSIDEQRSTEWMKFQSLNDFLDPNDRNKTIEGHPAPLRATITARAE